MCIRRPQSSRDAACVWLLSVVVVCVAPACEDPGHDASYYACIDTDLPPLPEHPRAAEFQRAVDDAVAAGLPGLLVYVRDPLGPWHGAAGYADLASGVPMLPCHRAKAGSIHKSFVATTIMLLVEEGLIALDDRMVDLFPESLTGRIANSDIIELRHLLNHTSGLATCTWDQANWLSGIDNPSGDSGEVDCITFIYDADPQFQPGEDYFYTNVEYDLLVLLIETITGQPVEEVLEERIFEPLQMLSTDDHAEFVSEGVVRGYLDLYGNGALINASELYYDANDGMITTTRDLGTFYDALLRDRILLSDSSMEAMLDFVDTGEDTFSGYGFALQRYESEHGLAWGHGGKMYGYLAKAYYFPDSDVTVVILYNSSELYSDRGVLYGAIVDAWDDIVDLAMNP